MTSRKRRNQGGTSSDYLISRIARDRPDILERMKHLEYSSVAQAARDAGIGAAQPLKRVALTDNLERVAGSLTSYYAPLQVAYLVAFLMEDERVQAVFDDLQGNVDVHQHLDVE